MYSAAPGAWGNRRWNYKIDLNTLLTYTILYRHDILLQSYPHREANPGPLRRNPIH